MSNKQHQEILGLDIGTKRTGVARMHTASRLPEPLGIIDMKGNEEFISMIKKYITEHNSESIVVGVPRGLNRQDTDQTRITMKTVSLLKESLQDMSIFLIDETGSSVEGRMRSKNAKHIDDHAAAVILEDFAAAWDRGDYVSK